MNKFFRIIGYLEGSSFLVLLGIAMPLKHYWGMPLAVRYVGWAHGLLFILYVGTAFAISEKLDRPAGFLRSAFLAALIPFGPFVLQHRLNSRTN